MALRLCNTARCSTIAASPPRIEVATEVNDVLTISYDDASDSINIKTINVENVDPVFSSLAPAHATVTSAARPVLSGDVADADSGVQQDPSGRETIKFVVRATELDGTTVPKGPETLSPADTGTVSQAGSVFSVTQRVTATLVSSEDIYLIQWWLIAEDVVGNLAVSDEDNLTACDPNVFTVDTGGTAFAACDPFEIRIDSQAPAAVPGVTLWGLVALAGGFGVLVAWRMRHRQTQS